jgi:hypothetical protein
MALKLGKIFDLRQYINQQAVVIIAGFLLLGWLMATFTFGTGQQTIFLPGETSEGHALFEASCTSCHEGFKPVSNETCLRCHETEMAEDKHGAKKFRDPRYAEDLAKLEVLTCTTCHNEHVHMYGRGVHLQPNLCMTCHQGIIEGDMQSHNGFEASGCWAAGCHNYHDHRAISTGFLYDNLDQLPMLQLQTVLELTRGTTQDRAPAPDLHQEFLGGA